MEFRTQIAIAKPLFDFSYKDRIMLFGSCFAENIGEKLYENNFITDINPFGTLYNPASVACALRMLFHPRELSASDLFEHNSLYHSFMYHGRFSSQKMEEALCNMNGRLLDAHDNLQETTRLVITLGTAFVYRLKSDGQVVSNCHKLPEKFFSREMLTVKDIVDEWDTLLLSVWEQKPNLKILLTISPIRHWKDGAHQNQLSKATLLLAADILQKRYPGQIGYFPSYEIMMDELRDYRFYADDMLHPSPLAIEYIWQTFVQHFLQDETKAILKDWQEIKKAINHKPFQPDSEAYRGFISQTLLKAEHIKEKFPYFGIEEEVEFLQNKLT